MAAAIGSSVGGSMPAAYSTAGPGTTTSVVGPASNVRGQEGCTDAHGRGDDVAKRLEQLDRQIKQLLDAELASVWLEEDERRRLDEQLRGLMQQRLQALQPEQSVQPCGHAQGTGPVRGVADAGGDRVDAAARAAVTSSAPVAASGASPSPAVVAATYAAGAAGGAAA